MTRTGTQLRFGDRVHTQLSRGRPSGRGHQLEMSVRRSGHLCPSFFCSNCSDWMAMRIMGLEQTGSSVPLLPQRAISTRGPLDVEVVVSR
jgi:hypothetical protein